MPILVFSQEFSISGKVQSIDKQPISFANVVLMTVVDSTIVKGTSTNDNGTFVMHSIPQNDYVLKISFIGFKTFSKQFSISKNLKLETITLEEDTESLKEISITYKKPTVKKESDRIVFDIENSALSEGNMMQVLKNTPGVLVIGNNITVKNSEPTVFINNRKVHLSSDELSQLLESSDANNVKSVEVITNPSAKYDASSSAVINITMSKNLITGYRGNVFTNYTQGVFPRYNVGTGHFFKSDKINFNINYSYTHDKLNRDNKEQTEFFNNNVIDEVWKSKINRNTWSKTHNVNFNFDFFADDKNTLSLSSSMLFLPDFDYEINNRTNIFNSYGNLQYYFLSNNNTKDKKHNLGFDFDFEHKFNKPGAKLTINTHFTTYDYTRDQIVNTNFFDNIDIFVGASDYLTNSNQDTNIYSARADYTIPTSNTSMFEAGIKTSVINTESAIEKFDYLGGNPVVDVNNTDSFKYDETIFSAYANFSKEWNKWSIIAGLRAEQTEVEGTSVLYGETNTQDYLEWFPNASLNFDASDNISIYANYKRSISRPNYQDLNPFQFYLNDYSLVTGNPNLKPIFIDYGVFGISFEETYFIEAYYSKKKNNIYELPLQDNNTNIVSWTPINFDKTIEYGFDFLTNFYVNDRWFVYAVTSFYNIKDQNDFGGEQVKKDRWSNYSVLQNDFTLLKDRSLNINLTMYWVGKNLQGLREVENRLISSLSISKSLWNKKASISLMFEDLFNTHDYDYKTKFLTQSNSSHADFDNRYIKIGFRYKFGNTILNTNERSKDLKERNRLKDWN